MHVMQAKRGTSLTKAVRYLAITIFLVATLDLFTKSIALQRLGSEPVQVIGKYLQLHLIFNSGAAFSIGAHRAFFFSLFSITAALLIIIKAQKFEHSYWLVASGLVVGGILGNLIDRIFRPPGSLSGQVVDWIELAHWPIFNLADSSIVLGASLVTFLVARNIKPRELT